MHSLDALSSSSLLSTASPGVLASLLESLPQFIFWKDTESRYCGCNTAFAALLGFSSPEEIIGKTDFELGWQVQGDHAWLFREDDQAAMKGEPIVNQEETLALENREPLIVSVNKRALCDKSGEVIGVLATAMDITAQKKAEHTLRQAKAQAECARQAKSAFMDNICHDIRTPLSGLVGVTENLGKHSTGELKESLSLLHDASKTLLSWFNQLFQMLRAESGVGLQTVVPFSVKETVQGILMLLQPVAQQKGLHLSAEYAHSLPEMLVGDDLRLKNILLNLITNAITFTPEGSVSVEVGGKAIDNHRFGLKITVIDTGIGIALNDQITIFDPFSRLDPAYRGMRSAPGVGLAIASQLIRDLQGTIMLESVPGQGSRFCIELPLLFPQKEENSK
jgi:two-component system aerobic respiration control sensor histidine kinase ArcB